MYSVDWRICSVEKLGKMRKIRLLSRKKALESHVGAEKIPDRGTTGSTKILAEEGSKFFV